MTQGFEPPEIGELEISSPDIVGPRTDADRVRRRRAVAGLGAAMAIAAAGGVGFGIGRSVDDGGTASTGDATEVTVAPDDTASLPSMETLPPVDDEAPAEEPAAASADEPSMSVTVTAPSVAREEATDDIDLVDGGFATDEMWMPQPMTLVYERTLPTGERVRLQRGQPYEFEPWTTETGWQPEPWCWSGTDGRVTIDGPDLVDVMYVSYHEAPFKGLAVELVDLGYADGVPLRVMVVRTDTATEVAVTWSDGQADRTAVADGTAVLVVPGGNPWGFDYTLELVEPTGTRTLTQADTAYWDDPDWIAGCTEPPPALPEPGEQPADPAAAEAALRDAYALLWDTSVPNDDKRYLVDDWTGVEEATAIVQENYGDVATTAVHEMDDVVFTSPTEAWFFYSVFTDITDFRGRYGTATLVDGQWVFPRAMMCQDLSLGGAECVPEFEPIYSPAWIDLYGEE